MLSVNLLIDSYMFLRMRMGGPYIGQWRKSGNEQRLLNREGWKVKMFYSRMILKYENLIADFSDYQLKKPFRTRIRL